MSLTELTFDLFYCVQSQTESSKIQLELGSFENVENAETF